MVDAVRPDRSNFAVNPQHIKALVDSIDQAKVQQVFPTSNKLPWAIYVQICAYADQAGSDTGAQLLEKILAMQTQPGDHDHKVAMFGRAIVAHVALDKQLIQDNDDTLDSYHPKAAKITQYRDQYGTQCIEAVMAYMMQTRDANIAWNKDGGNVQLNVSTAFKQAHDTRASIQSWCLAVWPH